MELLSQVIESLKEKYQHLQPKPPAEPEIPDYLNLPNSLIVRKVRNAYIVDDLKIKKSFTVSRVAGVVLCSCDKGKELPHCLHKIEVWREAQRLKKLHVDEYIKAKINAAISLYIHHLRQVVSEFEANGDTRSGSYWYNRGRLQAYRHVIKTIIDA